MEQIIIKCRCVYKGHKSGEALVSHEGVGGWGSVEECSGTVTERGHELQGKSVKDKVLVFPYAKGSCGWAKVFQNMAHFGSSPAAMIIRTIDNRSALGAVTSRTASVTDAEIDPLTVIETGDWVDVNADQGIITVTKKENGSLPEVD